MTDEFDSYRHAALLIEHYHDEAEDYAIARANEFKARRSPDGYKIWTRVLSSIRVLRRGATSVAR